MTSTRHVPQHAPSRPQSSRGARGHADTLKHFQTKHRGLDVRHLAFVLTAVFGLSVIFYPVATHWFASQSQARQLTHYSSVTSSPGSSRILEAARQYNEELTIFDQTEYSNQLRFEGTPVMAALRVPSVGINLPIYHGTSEEVLLRGVGHAEASHLPVGGPGTNSVLTAHTGLPRSSMFDSLHSVKIGDEVIIDVGGTQLSYEVLRKEVLDPETAEKRAAARPNGDHLTLVTCTPYSVNSHRLVVTAQRVADELTLPREEAGTRSRSHPLWIVVYVAGIAGILGLAYVSSMSSRQQVVGRPVNFEPNNKRTLTGSRCDRRLDSQPQSGTH